MEEEDPDGDLQERSQEDHIHTFPFNPTLTQNYRHHHRQQQSHLFYEGRLEDTLPPQDLQRQPPKKRPFILQSSVTDEYAQKMGDAHDHHQDAAVSVVVAAPSSRLGVRGRGGGGGGEIVEVQGGHIIRSTGQKDRHSKVCTSKGPRDRRVRLSAHTAIQFYDVQDRLGYDRPSKAVDWLIKKAKASIDELAELPAWKPTAGTTTAAASSSRVQEEEPQKQGDEPESHQCGNCPQGQDLLDASKMCWGDGYSSSGAISSNSVGQNRHQQQVNENRGFLPPSLDTDSIADTIKSFFPAGAGAGAAASASASETQQQQPSLPAMQSVQFHRYSHPPDLLSRMSSHQSQDLRLSLHSFQDPMLLHHHHHQEQTQSHEQPPSAAFSGSTGYTGLDMSHASSLWSDVARFQRMPVWNTATAASDTGDGGGGNSIGAVAFGSQQPIIPQSFFGQSQSQYFSQRGYLQSSYMPSLRAWIDPTIAPKNQIPHQLTETSSSISGLGFGGGGFLGYHIPARIQGQEEDQDDGAIMKFELLSHSP
ncbi:hypothetical protein SAY86_006600 [Trapa natans]|uniref:TCP domain-containing protein n=1 Tax=Trapa natans TaxID=22666 RepID=A0AAN7QUE0_TRANT|nr:hypothetical protein SAY86_006600 [Trapa natans]